MDTHNQVPAPQSPFEGITQKLYDYFPPNMRPTPDLLAEARLRLPALPQDVAKRLYEGTGTPEDSLAEQEADAREAEYARIANPTVTRYVNGNTVEVRTNNDLDCIVTRYASDADRQASKPAFLVSITGDSRGVIGLPDAEGQLQYTEVTDPAQLAANVLDLLDHSTEQPPTA